LDDPYRWLIIGYGETRPLVANDTEVNQQRNRRVEI
ncbi:MAG: OmpA family protein, partial [Moorea sp. SIO4A1]|nr:OmpA family protein [Moorena sp. SIO4A1]